MHLQAFCQITEKCSYLCNGYFQLLLSTDTINHKLCQINCQYQLKVTQKVSCSMSSDSLFAIPQYQSDVEDLLW